MRFTFKRRPSGSSGRRKPKSEEEKQANKAARKEKTEAKQAAAKLEKERLKGAFCWHCNKLKKPQIEAFAARAASDPRLVRCAVRSGHYVQCKAFLQFGEKVSIAWLEENWPEAGACKWEATAQTEWDKMLANDIWGGWEVLRNEVRTYKYGATNNPPRSSSARSGSEGASSSSAAEEGAGPSGTSSEADATANPLAALLSVASQKRKTVVRRPRKQNARGGDGSAGAAALAAPPEPLHAAPPEPERAAPPPGVPLKQEVVQEVMWAEAQLEASSDEDD
jgi:hypothetical protein